MAAQLKHFCFTVYQDNVPEDWTPAKEFCSYIVFQWEKCPETNRVHAQGYIELKKKTRFLKIKRSVLKTDTAHIEKRRGSAIQAAEYCKKEDTRLFEGLEWGEISQPHQGQRTDLIAFKNKIGKEPLRYLLDNFTYEMARHGHFYDRELAQSRKEQSRGFRRMDVRVYWGGAGTGKTRSVYEEFGYEVVYTLTINGKEKIWFDGYDGEKVLLLDDFYGNMCHAFFLRLTDGHPVRLDVKGTHTYALFTTVIITSNLNPNLWYRNLHNLHPDTKVAFDRRITTIKHFT